jgi:hypothetical protein
VLTYRFVSGSAEDLRTYLQGLYGEPASLVGAQFIGDLPYVIYEKFDSYGNWPCDLFFMDMLGHMEDPVIREGCSILKQICPYYEWLGSYPRADVLDLNG